MGLHSELKLAVPWGHIALKVWGSQKNPPVLCLHGWLDNANSFDRLIPLLPQDFCYMAMDFGGHGLSSHYNPGLPYYQQNFEMENILTYRRRNIEHTLQVEASQKKSLRAVSPEEMLQGFLNNNSHLDKDCGELILQRGTTKVDAGLVLNRDRRISWPENSFDFVSKEMFVHSAKSLQASVLMIKALQGYYDVRRANDADKAPMHFMVDTLRSTLKERFQFVEVPGNHYIHMNKPQVVAGVVGPFLQGLQRMTSARL